MEDLEAVCQRDVIIQIFFCSLARGFHHLLGSRGIARFRRTQRRHLHVRTHIHVAFHGMHGVGAGVAVFVRVFVFIRGDVHAFHVRHVMAGHIHAGHALLAAGRGAAAAPGRLLLAPGGAS